MGRVLLLRVEGTVHHGWRRLGRQLALGNAWRASGGDVVLLSHTLPAALATAARVEGWAAHHLVPAPGTPNDGAETARLAARLGAAVLSVDLPHLGLPWLSVTEDVLRVVFEPPPEIATCSVEVVVHPWTWPASARGHTSERGARELLGPAYAVPQAALRRFRRPEANESMPATRVAVFEGVGWPAGAIHGLVAALNAVGLSATVAAMPPSPGTVPDWVGAELAVVGLGAPLSDLAYLGIPILLTGVSVEGEEWAGMLAALGLVRWARFAGPFQLGACAEMAADLARDGSALRMLADAGRALVDGRGAERVIAALQTSPALPGALRVVPATWSDRARLFAWANDPSVRSRAFDPRPIPWSGHCAWLRARLASDDCHIFIGWVSDKAAVGPVRFDRIGGEDWEVTVAVAPEQRGRRRSSQLIAAGCAALASRCGAQVRIRARIRRDNIASLRAFSRAGFGPLAPAPFDGVDAVACWWTVSDLRAR